MLQFTQALCTMAARAPAGIAALALAGRTLAGAGLLALAGCSTLYPRVQVGETAAPVQLPTAASVVAAPNGAIFQAAGYRPLFEDHRARMVGDTLVVRIVERVSASASSTSSVDRTGRLAGNVTALPGVRPTDFGRARIGAENNNTFAGKGATESSNDFSGTITVTVRQVLPNGHLLITGEKQIGVNAAVDVLRFSGQVDPRAIQPGNTVPSAQIANVRLEHRGRGAQADAQAMGWLQRVFLSVMPI
jgi:flagellar L-ring protein precursor FlgH